MLTAIAAFAPALRGGLLLDDHRLLVEDSRVHSLANVGAWFSTDFAASAAGGVSGEQLAYYRPLVTASYALDHAWGKGEPWAFHATNVGWHSLASVLVLGALTRFSRSRSLALAGALLFALHPTRAESVAWISGRPDLMLAVAVLLAASGAAMRFSGRSGGAALEALGTLAAYLTKETAIVLPVLVGVEAWVASRRLPLDRRAFVLMLRAAAPQLLVAAGYLGARAAFLPLHPEGILSLPLATHAGLVLETFGRALGLLLAPFDLSLFHVLARAPGGGIALEMPYVVGGALALLGLLAVALRLRWLRPAVSVGLVAFVLLLAPTLNLIPTRQPVVLAERFLYLPLLGGLYAVSAAFAGVLHARAVLVGLVGAALGASAAASVTRAGYFGEPRLLWEHEARRSFPGFEACVEIGRIALAERRPRAALAARARALEVAQQSFVSPRRATEVSIGAALLLLDTTSDRERDTLRKLDQAFVALSERPPRDAVVAAGPLVLRIGVADERARAAVSARIPELLAARADIVSRLGDNVAAERLVQLALSTCRDGRLPAHCGPALSRLALVRARPGELAGGSERLGDAASAESTRARLLEARHLRALAEGDGPEALMARAWAFGALGAWGRGYAVLAPHAGKIREAPDAARAFAEIAWRAGEREAAKAALEPHLDDDELERLTLAWSRSMGWADD